MKEKILFVALIFSIKGNFQCWNKLLLSVEHTYASKSDNIFWIWGRNDFGELGTGTIG